MTHQKGIQHFTGTAYEVRYTAGRTFGQRLEWLISDYQHAYPDALNVVQWEQLQEGALPWLRRLPTRFQEEYEGLATGSGVPLQRIAVVVLQFWWLSRGKSGELAVDSLAMVSTVCPTFFFSGALRPR